MIVQIHKDGQKSTVTLENHANNDVIIFQLWDEEEKDRLIDSIVDKYLDKNM